MTKVTPIHTSPSCQSPQSTIVITGNPNLYRAVRFCKEPVTVICPFCRHVVTTKVEPKVTEKTHFVALLLCLFSSWICCCCCLPYCMDSCQGRNHYCAHCNAFLGVYTN